MGREELEGEWKLMIGDALREFGEKCLNEGIKEVVEWVNEHGQIRTWTDFGEFGQGVISKYCLSETSWQEQKKKWGL